MTHKLLALVRLIALSNRKFVFYMYLGVLCLCCTE